MSVAYEQQASTGLQQLGLAVAEKSRARMSASQKRQQAARWGWLPSSLPPWLTQSSYREMILPRLAQITVPTIARTLNVSEPYAAKVRKGQYVPHPMHWQALAKLVGVSASRSSAGPTPPASQALAGASGTGGSFGMNAGRKQSTQLSHVPESHALAA